MAHVQHSIWSNSTKIDIGRVLVEARGKALTAGQIQRSIGGSHQSNFKKIIKELVAAGALERVDPPPPSGQPGRPPEDAFVFADGELGRLEELLEDLEEESSWPRDGRSELVVVDAQDAREKREEFWSLLAQMETAAGMRRLRKVGGDQAEWQFEFDGPTAVDDADNLAEAFLTADLNPRRQHVGQSSSPVEMRRRARQLLKTMEQSRELLAAMRTGPSSEPGERG